MIERRQLDRIAFNIHQKLAKKDLKAEDVIYISEKIKMETYRDINVQDIDAGLHLQDLEEDNEETED